MLRRIISVLFGAIGFGAGATAQDHVSIGHTDVQLPSGWSITEKQEGGDRVVVRTADGRQQATLSILRFGADASFEDFKRLCEHRIRAEKEEIADGFVQPDAPFERAGTFGMFFSGGEKQIGRVFSGYLFLSKRELLTIYVEGLGIAPTDHVASFEAFVKGVKK